MQGRWLLLVGIWSLAAVAAEDDAPPLTNGITRYLSGNEPSYFALARDEGERSFHGRFYVSIKYPLLQHYLPDGATLNFNYNGLYDFYLGTRYSSPIVSRRQNPGLMYEYEFANDKLLRKAKLGYFHESNGQTIDTEAKYLSTENAQDFISRGWDYLHLELSMASADDWGFYMIGHYFMPKQVFTLEREEKRPWEAPAGEEQPIKAYDGIRLIVNRGSNFYHRNFNHLGLSAIYRTGYDDPGHNSTRRFEVRARVFDLPLYAYYVGGYGINLSSYYLKSSSYGFGFEFW